MTVEDLLETAENPAVPTSPTTPPAPTLDEQPPPESTLKDQRAPMPPQSSQKKAVDPKAAVQPKRKPSAMSSRQQRPPREPREKNQRYQDVEATGKWGNVSTTETYAAIGCFALVVIGAVVAAVVVITGREPPEAEVVPAEPRATSSPTAAPTKISDKGLLNQVLDEIYANEYTFPIVDDMPLTAPEYETLFDDPSATPQQRAMSWLLYQDEWEVSSDATSRWALAAIYLQMGGESSWLESDGWLTDASICDWERISCSPTTGALRELDLQRNGLAGTIPSELALLPTIQSLWMRENGLVGTIPGAMLGSLPTLSILYLDENALTGTVPKELLNNDVLNSLFLQFNDLTGTWPREFCPSASEGEGEKPIDRFGLDCDDIACFSTCCDEFNCYYGEPVQNP